MKRLREVRNTPHRNASGKVCRLEVAQGMDTMCAQNPWTIAIPFFSRTLCEGARPTKGLIIVSRVRSQHMLRSFDSGEASSVSGSVRRVSMPTTRSSAVLPCRVRM